MHMKYFQALADIQRHYDDVIDYFDRPDFGHSLLSSWGISLDQKPLLEQEQEAMRYLVSCRLEMTRGTNVQKPSITVINRCLKRHLHFLETIHKCHAYNVNKHHSNIIRKQYKACKHYLFKLSYPTQYAKMPNEILTFENRYPDFESSRNL